MPVYEYVCEKCGATTEALRKMAQADEPLACGKCGSAKTRRKQSVFAAASAESRDTSLPMGGCGRCGNPDGPCQFS